MPYNAPRKNLKYFIVTMSKTRSSALRRLESHNKSPQHGDFEGELNNSRRESRESERRRERHRSQSHSSRRSRSRQRSRSNDREETIPGWAQQLLNGQRESDQRLKTLEKQLKDKNAKQSSARKREHSPTPEFKYKRNKVQYELNKSILDKIETALDASDDEEHSGALDEGRKMLIERNKHIKLAEKYRWEAVDCYIDEPLASDSDDDKKIRRAIKESKVLKEEKRKSARASRLPVNSSQSQVGTQPQRIPNENNFRQVIKRSPGSVPAQDTTCFRCGRKGHYARHCRSLVALNDSSRPTNN